MFSRLLRKVLRTHYMQTACMARSGRRPPKERSFAVHDQEDDDVVYSDDEREIYLDEIAGILSRNENPGTLVPEHKKKSNKQLQREFLKQKIIKSKERNLLFPKEPLLLTWAARKQLQYLNYMDRSYWSPTMLADSFPVSPTLAKKLLRSVLIPADKSAIVDYDKRVYQKWLNLKSILEVEEEEKETQMDEDMKWAERCVRKYLHLLPFAAGNTSLPMPPDDYVYRTVETIVGEKKPGVKPYFSLILTECGQKVDAPKEDTVSRESPIGFYDNSVRLLLEGMAELGHDKKPDQRFGYEKNSNLQRKVPLFGTDRYEVEGGIVTRLHFPNENYEQKKSNTKWEPAEFQRYGKLPITYGNDNRNRRQRENHDELDSNNTKNISWREDYDELDRKNSRNIRWRENDNDVKRNDSEDMRSKDYYDELRKNFMQISLHHLKQRKD